MIKRILLSLLLVSSNAFAAITDGKFGINQIFDVQYWWNGTTLNASNFIAPYDKNFQTVTVTSGQYFQFFPSTTNPGTYGLKLMNSNGTQARIIHDTGDITALGNGAIFYIGSGFFGNVITTAQGYNYGASATFTNMDTSVSSTDLNNYTFASTTPLSAGQTAAPTPQPTAIYFNNANVRITNIWATSNNSPAGEGAANAFDNNPNTKYLNFDKQNAGVTVKLNEGRVVNGFTITTANDFSGRDPTSYKLYGSNDGTTWVLIQEGALSLSNNRFTTSSMINVTNSSAYAYYYIMFPTTKAGTGCGLDCDSMQIAEITYYYDANNTTTSTATGGTSAPVDPVQAAAGPSVEGGTITQTNSPGTSGQTITSGGSSTAGATTVQQTRVDTWVNATQVRNNELYIDQTYGTNNAVTITQSGEKNKIEFTLSGNNNVVNNSQTGKNYLKQEIPGWGNNVITNQTSTTNSTYAETKIQGNGNTINHSQSGTGNHILFSNITGDINSVTTKQAGSAGHLADVKLSGNHNSALVDQFGSTQNKANIDLTNSGGAASLDLQQSGGKNFTIIQNCLNPSGCSTVVRQ